MNQVSIVNLSKETAGVEASDAEKLQKAFEPFFQRVEDWKEKAMAIKVTNVAQRNEMAQAREARLILRDVRLNAEKTRKELKEDALRYGQSIDAIARMIKTAIEPIEAHLEQQEKFAEIQAAKEREERRQLREFEFSPFAEFAPTHVDIYAVDDEEYAHILSVCKGMYEAKRLESERIQAEKEEAARLEREENERIRAENERLKQEAIAAAAQLEKEREAVRKAEQEYNNRIAAERAENERIQREQQARELAEKQQIEAQEKAAKEAPDRDKLRKLADDFAAIPKPDFESEEWESKYRVAMDYISKGIKYIREQ